MTNKPPTRPGDGAQPIPGLATAEGTARFETRFAGRCADDFYRALGRDGLRVSSVGLGSYLGECDDADDGGYTSTARAALELGVNLLDTAINYRCQRSERALGRALAQSIDDGIVRRDEVVVCTKGGYIPLDGNAPATREDYQAYVAREYFERGIMEPDDVVGGGHCLAPGFLASQIERSRANLGLETLDVYYIHNPEQQLDAVPHDELLSRLARAFELLEVRCERGEIGVYGCATWNGLRSAPDARDHVELAELVEIAHEVAGDAHHFRVVQLPVNLAFTEAVRAPTQTVEGRSMTVLEAAAALGVSVVASATLLQGKLAANLPAELHDAIPGHATDAQRAIAFVRSLPVISAGLVGMKRREHLVENLDSGSH